MKVLTFLKKNLIVVFFFVFIFAVSVDYCIGMIGKFTNPASDAGQSVSPGYNEEYFALQEQLREDSLENATTKNDTTVIEETGFQKFLALFQRVTGSASNFGSRSVRPYLLELNALVCSSDGLYSRHDVFEAGKRNACCAG